MNENEKALLKELQELRQEHIALRTLYDKEMSEIRVREMHLSECRDKYRFMFEYNLQPNWIFDMQTLLFVEVNEAAIRHYGYSREEFLSMTIKDIRPHNDITLLLEDIEKTRNPYRNAGEWRHFKKNGELIFVEISSRAVLFNGRDSRHVLIHDITDRRLGEEALKKANQELEKLHNNLDEAIFSVDIVQNEMIYASIAHQTVFGHSPDEFFKNPNLWYEIILPEDKPIVDAGYPLLFAGKNLRHEFRIADLEGKTRWIEAKMNPTLDKSGKLIRIDGVASDITQRKKIEAEFLESEINFRRSISESPVGIRIVSVKGDTIYANKAFLDMYEYNSLDEFTGIPALNRYTPESYAQYQERKKIRKAGGEIFDYEISIICKNKDIRHVKVSRKEILWNGTKHFQLINLDITEQRNAEEQLRKLSRAVEQSPDAICITDPCGVIEYVNPRTIELTGFKIEELMGSKTSIFSSGEKPREEYAILWKTIKSGNVWIGELHNRKKNGELYWENTTISPIFDKEGHITHFLSIKEDITASKKMLRDLIVAKERAEESELFLRTFIENIPFEVWARDVSHVGILENKKLVDHYGSIIGKIPKLSAKTNLQTVQLWESIIKRLSNGELIDEEYTYETNHQKIVYQKIAFPIYNKTEIIGLAGFNINITERKQVEIALNNSEEQLRKFASHLQNVREEEKIALAREIHDDLGQILVALKIDLGLLKQKVMKTNTLANSQEILPRFENIVLLIDNTIKTARRIMNGLRPEMLELHGFVGASKEYLREFEERHKLISKFTCDVPDLQMNSQQSLTFFRILQEALNNIIKHAKATLVEIRLSHTDTKLCLEISDNGVGFDKCNHGREDSYGMLGMKERVILLEGELNIISEPGQGTTVRVEIPF